LLRWLPPRLPSRRSEVFQEILKARVEVCVLEVDEPCRHGGHRQDALAEEDDGSNGQKQHHRRPPLASGQRAAHN
jgi:hypothetical protein